MADRETIMSMTRILNSFRHPISYNFTSCLSFVDDPSRDGLEYKYLRNNSSTVRVVLF